tara:strand:+ start:972 stop:1544 length:573 start_codon:yes stop_codon:yes gene_type:complete
MSGNKKEHTLLTEDIKALFCEGDPSAMEAVYNEVKSQTVSWASGYLSSREDAEDASSEAWVKVFEKKNTLRSPTALMGFIKTTTVRCSLDLLRKLKKTKGNLSYTETECQRSVDPLEDSLAREELRLMYKAINAISPIYSEAITGRLNGMSLDAMSRSFECPVGTMKRRVHHAKNLIMESTRHLRESDNG